MPRLHDAVYYNKLYDVKKFVEAGDDVNGWTKIIVPYL